MRAIGGRYEEWCPGGLCGWICVVLYVFSSVDDCCLRLREKASKSASMEFKGLKHS